MYMSQVILITSAHHQALNAHHFPPHKWPENPSFAADQIRSAADENYQLNLKTKLCQISAPLFLG
jgi:hypothetical protein